MKIRPIKDSDVNFILSTWLKSYYEALKNYGAKGAPYPKDDIFFQGHQNKIKKALESNICLICVAPDDDNQIIGYIVYGADCLHFCYVKQVFRKMGVARELRAKAIAVTSYSHHTPYARYVNDGLTYDPYRF